MFKFVDLEVIAMIARRTLNYTTILVFFSFVFLFFSQVTGQDVRVNIPESTFDKLQRIQDSTLMARAPLLPFPQKYRTRSLPPLVDNSQNSYWPGIRDQYMFSSCQQHAGVGYVFNYEINRLRNQPGSNPDNRYPPHYTWNFMNLGEKYEGANYIQSFDIIRHQGHINSTGYGDDTSRAWLGWVSGYEQYYQGMFNRMKKYNAIEVNSAQGILQLKNYLYDHLDGSSTGGIVCFTTSSGTFVTMPQIPPGLPEAGKDIVVSWMTPPIHGLTVVGYNDSIRFDINQDGLFTNNLDINGDGTVDARDWEIGAFRIANSYGTWWSDAGYVYALYSSFASEYPFGGIWNNRVYTIEADTGYQPLLTAKVNFSHNLRNQVRIFAGVSADTSYDAPENILEFPVFNFQGGPHPMQGYDSVPGAENIETGLDITPLLNFVPGNSAARYFLSIEERDPEHTGNGTIHSVSFFHYGSTIEEINAFPSSVPIRDNAVTSVSAVAAFVKPEVRITTEQLPPFQSGQTYHAQLSATGGEPPYRWSLAQHYEKKGIEAGMPVTSGSSVYQSNWYVYFQAFPLPFSFPFYGKNYDTIYVNHYGFICLEPQYLPEAYITNEMSMLAAFPVIAPAFSRHYNYNNSSGDGLWVNTDNEKAIVRWHLSVSPYISNSVNDFALVLYRNGEFSFRYGNMDNRFFTQTTFSGVSKGDNISHDLEINWNANDLKNKSWLFHPVEVPRGAEISEDGILTFQEADSVKMYNISVIATDEGRIESTRQFTLAGNLLAEIFPDDSTQPKLKPGLLTPLTVRLINRGPENLQQLRLSVTSGDAMIVIPDSNEILNSLNPGQTVTIPGAFHILPSAHLPDGYPLVIDFRASSGLKIWKKEVCFHIMAPVIRVESCIIRDGDNQLLDPGEVADLEVTVRNAGLLSAENLRIGSETTSDKIQILSDESIPVEMLAPSMQVRGIFRLKAAQDIKSGTVDTLIITLRDTAGVIIQQKTPLMIGKTQVAIVTLSAVTQSGKAMKQVLDSLQVTYDTIVSLPFEYGNYASVFLNLGCSSQGSHTLTTNEATSLTGYLMNNGNLYMESYTSWYYLNHTPLHPWFMYTSKKVPAWFYPQAKGVDGTFGEGLSFNQNSSITYAVFDFLPVAPAFASFTNKDSIPKCVQVACDAGTYRTIGSMLEFSSLAGDNPLSTRKNLMQRYLEFFGVNITGPYPLFHADNPLICSGKQVIFADDSWPGVNARSWEFPGGVPASSTLPNPVVTYSQPGKYDVTLVVSNGIHTKSLTRKQFISVETCAGIESITRNEHLRVYPNPASDYIYISFEYPGLIHDVCLQDISGKMVRKWHKPGVSEIGNMNLSLRGIPAGIYILQFQTAESRIHRKLIVR